MKKLLRFIIRPAPESGEPNTDGLLVGACFKGHNLKPGHVYEVSEIMDTLVVKDVGESHIPVRSPGGSCWGNEIGHLVDCWGKFLILTKDEYLACC